MDSIKDMLELLQTNIFPIILGIFVIMSGIITMYTIIGKFSEIIGKPVKWVKDKKKDHEILMDVCKKVDEYADNRIHDRQQSFKIQSDLIESNKQLEHSIKDIFILISKMEKKTDERFEESEKKNKKRLRAELKEKIAAIYRRHHKINTINAMEFEVLKDLIKEYEAADGMNSFVHDTVEKEMHLWDKTEQ